MTEIRRSEADRIDLESFMSTNPAEMARKASCAQSVDLSLRSLVTTLQRVPACKTEQERALLLEGAARELKKVENDGLTLQRIVSVDVASHRRSAHASMVVAALSGAGVFVVFALAVVGFAVGGATLVPLGVVLSGVVVAGGLAFRREATRADQCDNQLVALTSLLGDADAVRGAIQRDALSLRVDALPIGRLSAYPSFAPRMKSPTLPSTLF